MRALRTISIILLSLLGVAAAVGAVLWSASLAGLARAETVATSAMAPDLAAGDLVIATPRSSAELRAGDVVSVPSPGATRLERIVSIEATGPDAWSVVTAADAGGERTTSHSVGATAWTPSLRVPALGGIAAAAVEPRFAIPAVAGVLLLSAILLVGRAPAGAVRRTA